VDSVATVADIKVEDPIFAEDATRVIEDQLRKEEKTKLKVCSKAVSNEYGSSANRLQISSVSCTWYKASCIAWLHYRHWDRAQKAEKFLNSGGKVLGRKLECKVQATLQKVGTIRIVFIQSESATSTSEPRLMT
jgi:hypothetical protein